MIKPKIDPRAQAALARIQKISQSAPMRMSFPIAGENFGEPIQGDPQGVVVAEEQLPPLEEDQDEERVARRLLAVQSTGIGHVARTNVNKYNEDKTGVDRINRMIGLGPDGKPLQGAESPTAIAQSIGVVERIATPELIDIAVADDSTIPNQQSHVGV